MGLILLIVLLWLIFGGGTGYYVHNRFEGNPFATGRGILLPLLLILLFFWLFRGYGGI